jgi:hypothetical protein
MGQEKEKIHLMRDMRHRRRPSPWLLQLPQSLLGVHAGPVSRVAEDGDLTRGAVGAGEAGQRCCVQHPLKSFGLAFLGRFFVCVMFLTQLSNLKILPGRYLPWKFPAFEHPFSWPQSKMSSSHSHMKPWQPIPGSKLLWACAICRIPGVGCVIMSEYNQCWACHATEKQQQRARLEWETEWWRHEPRKHRRAPTA